MKINKYKTFLAMCMMFTMAIAATAQTGEQGAFPSYPGGDQALVTELMQQIEYPKLKQSSAPELKIVLSFAVETDGSVSDIKVLRGAKGAPEFDQAAVAALKKLKKFNPALKDGVPVKSELTLPVTFLVK